MSHDNIAFEALQVTHEENVADDDPILAMKATSDPDTLYLWEAMKEPDFNKFQEAMQKEIDGHTERGNWKLRLRSSLPKNATVLPAVWAMKRKRRISTREIYKWKARLNVDGSKQIRGLHYDQTYSPVVAWPATRFFLIQSLLNDWHTKQLDYVMEFPQANVERELYMEIPKGVRLQGVKNNKDYVLQLIRNLYGQKQAGRVWYQHLVRGLEKIGFTRSKIDECVFYYNKSVLLVYVDDSILMGPDEQELKYLTKKKFEIEEEGDIGDYLGIQIQRKDDGSMVLTQPQLIRSILEDLGLQAANVKGRTTPALKTVLIHKDGGGKPHDNSFHYRSVIGKLNFLKKSTRLEIAYAVHQCACFCSAPKQSHAEAVKRIGRYLQSTQDKGLVIDPSGNNFTCYVDASHAGDWKQEAAIDDPTTARSRTGYVITYAQCPIVWGSKLQTEITLSTTEAEYIALSTSAREIIPLLSLAQEAATFGVINKVETPIIRCKIFEDNEGAVEMANVPKMRPRTKHLNIKYHFFRQFVEKGILQVLQFSGEQQIADVLTKPLEEASFTKHRKKITGW